VTYVCKYATFRSSASPAENLPLGARSVGLHRVAANWQDERFKLGHIVFIWGIAGKGKLIIDDSEFILEPECIGVYMPGQVMDISALDEEWEYCWWTMDGPNAEMIVRAFGFEAGIYPAGPAPTGQIKLLNNIIQKPGRDWELQAATIAYELLSSAAKFSRPRQTTQNDEKLVDAAISLILETLDNPDLSVDDLATALKTHRSTLSRRFRKVTGTTVIGYIIDLRMQNAAHLLKHTSSPIGDIALQCGYRDANYFSKQFRTVYNMKPSDLRVNR
jgi:AraC-like DNA-binding protein